MSKSRNWCFTLNNPNGFIPDLEIGWLKLCLWMRETGEQGTQHYQGYLEANHPISLGQLSKWMPRAHFEHRRGSQEQAIRYCLKVFLDNDDGQVDLMHHDECISSLSIYGLVTKGIDTSLTLEEYLESLVEKKEKPLLILKRLIDEGKTDKELADFDFVTWSRSYRALCHYRTISLPPRNHEMDIIVIIGPTGTGKSRWCMENYPGAFWKQKSQWWCGYGGEETIIIDEYYGWIKFDLLLRICDRYPLLMETKGGQVQMTSSRIIFTSNKIPDLWYPNVYFDAFIRRVNTWINMPHQGVEEKFKNYNEFKTKYYGLDNITITN